MGSLFCKRYITFQTLPTPAQQLCLCCLVDEYTTAFG